MKRGSGVGLSRRALLTRAVPACAGACVGLCVPGGLGALRAELAGQELHKFDVPLDRKLSQRQWITARYDALMGLTRTLRPVLGDEGLVRQLNAYSAEVGRSAGEQQAARSPDRSFQTFVRTFRPPAYASSLTHEVVEDTDKTFGLRVTECVWASVFRDAGLGGDIGHAAVCNMDYSWPTAFNPRFKMERTRTLMRGDDHCNHRYIDTE